jgi:hypothetical protein
MSLRENQNDFNMGHVAITVPDIDAAFVWHRDVLGCYVVANPSEANDGRLKSRKCSKRTSSARNAVV